MQKKVSFQVWFVHNHKQYNTLEMKFNAYPSLQLRHFVSVELVAGIVSTDVDNTRHLVCSVCSSC